MIIGKRDKSLFNHYKAQNRALRNDIYNYVYVIEECLKDKEINNKEKIKRILDIINELPCWITKIDYAEVFLSL